MRNRSIFFLLILFTVFISCNRQVPSESTELAVPVSVEDIRLRSIRQYVSTTGTVSATAEAAVNSEMAGDYYLQRNPATGSTYKLGDRVSKGAVIVRFENREFKNNLSVESVKLNLEISQQEYEKQKSLYEKGGVTLRELRNSEVSKTNAQYNYENVQIQLAKMDVESPFSGVITELPYFTQGVRVPSGSHMFTVMSYSQLYLTINLPEKNISEVQAGQEVLITNYTLPEDTLIGRVAELSPAVSTETRTFVGKIDVENPELKLRPGMFVKADIITRQKDSTIVISKDIIMSGNRGKYVFVVGRNSAADDRIIITGIENQNEVEVVQGLQRNERLIIKGYETLRDNSKVRIIR